MALYLVYFNSKYAFFLQVTVMWVTARMNSLANVKILTNVKVEMLRAI